MIENPAVMVVCKETLTLTNYLYCKAKARWLNLTTESSVSVAQSGATRVV